MKRILNSVLDLIYPRQCQICYSTDSCQDFPFLCKSCFQSAPTITPPLCQKCGHPFDGLISTPFECPNCRDHPLYFDRARAVFRFRGVIRHAIHHYKYSRQIYWEKVLQQWFVPTAVKWLESEPVDMALPIPLYPARKRERGFNQAQSLLSALQNAFPLNCPHHLLIRHRATETQTHLDREERLSNLHHAFRLTSPSAVQEKHILLIDDVLTTGSTASECSRILKESGAQKVTVFSLARG